MPLATDTLATASAAATIDAPAQQRQQTTTTPRKASTKAASTQSRAVNGHADTVFVWPGDRTLEDAIANIGADNRLVNTSSLRKVTSQETDSALSTATVQVSALEGTPRHEPPLHSLSSLSLALLGFALLSIGFMRITIPSFLNDTLGFLYGSLGWKKMEKESAFQNLLQTFVLEIMYYISVSMLVLEYTSLTSEWSFGTAEAALTVAAGALVLGIAYLLRYAMDFTIGYAFHIEQKMHNLVLYKRTTCGIIGLLLLPLSFVIPFLTTHNYTTIMTAAVLVVASLTIWRVIRSLKIIVSDLQSFVCFILYLCTVEVTPLVCAYRIASLTGITN